jgi:hypothetical protein
MRVTKKKLLIIYILFCPDLDVNIYQFGILIKRNYVMRLGIGNLNFIIIHENSIIFENGTIF